MGDLAGLPRWIDTAPVRRNLDYEVRRHHGAEIPQLPSGLSIHCKSDGGPPRWNGLCRGRVEHRTANHRDWNRPDNRDGEIQGSAATVDGGSDRTIGP